jgi:hypothetical protein
MQFTNVEIMDINSFMSLSAAIIMLIYVKLNVTQ